MSELAVIRETLRRAARRRRLDRALRGLWIGLFAGCAAWLLVIALHRIAPLPDALPELGWLAVLAAGVVGFVAGGWRPVPLSEAARIVEARHRLDQRLSTALELGGQLSASPSVPTWAQLVVADAHRAIQGLEITRLLPFRLPPPARWLPVLLVAIVGLGFVPAYRSTAYRQQQQDAAAIRETGRRVAELVRKELEKPEVQEPIREALEAAGDLGERLSQAKLTKADALRDLANATRRLEEEARQLDADPALRKLQQAARSPSGANNSAAANPALQKQLEKLQQSVGNNTPDAMDKLARQLEQAQQMAAGMQGGSQDAAGQQALSQALQQLAQNAASMGLDLASLNTALDAMKDLSLDRVLRDLKMAGQDLDKLRDMAKKLAEMQQAMQQAGKDLAEQLDRGQADAAAQTLEKMVEQLQSAGLTPEQTKQMLAEVTKALPPAGQYGKVGELLKNAADKLAAQAKPDAAKDLAQAAKELRQMAKDAQEMQMLAETLEALQEAQLAIASGRAWQPGGT